MVANRFQVSDVFFQFFAFQHVFRIFFKELLELHLGVYFVWHDVPGRTLRVTNVDGMRKKVDIPT